MGGQSLIKLQLSNECHCPEDFSVSSSPLLFFFFILFRPSGQYDDHFRKFTVAGPQGDFLSI